MRNTTTISENAELLSDRRINTYNLNAICWFLQNSLFPEGY